MRTADMPFRQLQPGHRIVAVDGNVVDPPQEIAEILNYGQIRARLVRSANAVTDHYLYPEMADSFTVEVPDAPVPIPRSVVDELSMVSKPWDRGVPTDLLRRIALAARSRAMLPRISGDPDPWFDGKTPRVGDVVMVQAWGNWQAGIALSVTPKRVRVAFVTCHGARAAHYPRAFRPYFPLADVRVLTGQPWLTPILANERKP